MDAVKEIKAADFAGAVVNGDKVAVVDFWAPWCGYCVRMAPVFEEVAGALSDKVNFFKVNTDEEFELARQYQIEVLPTFAIFKNGEMVDKKIGYVPASELKAFIEASL